MNNFSDNENLEKIEDKEKTEGKKKKIIHEIIEWLIYIVVFILIVWGTPQALVKILKTEYPIATVTSSSMWPVLKEGDIILVKGVSNKDDIQQGDIVIYTNDKGFTIHRVIRLRENDFVTQGDANNQEDAPVNYKQLIGKTVNLGRWPFRIPLLGKISNLFRK